MKKRIMKTTRRGFAFLLGLVMCMSLLPVTAFAAEEESSNSDDYVFIYINVTNLPKDGEEVPEPPKFGDDETEASVIAGLAAAEGTMDAAQETLTQSLTAVDNAVGQLSETMDRLTSSMGTTENQLGSAETALEALQGTAKPGSAGNGGQTREMSATGELKKSGQPENQDPPPAADPAPSFDEVKAKVEMLNQEKGEIDKAVSTANKEVDALNAAQAAADQAGTDGIGELEAKKTELETVKTELAAKRQDYTDNKKIAEDAVEEAKRKMGACETAKIVLDTKFQEEVGKLPAVSAAPTLQDGQDYGAYLKAYQAWEKECEAYNTKLGLIQDAHDTAAEELRKQSVAAEAAVAEAQVKLGIAQTKLDAFNAEVEENKAALDACNAEIEAHKANALAYNTQVDAYNQAAGSKAPVALQSVGADKNYNDEARDFNAAVDQYNQQVTNFDSAKTTYTESLTEHIDSVVGTMNTAVDSFNTTAGQYNQEAALWNADSSHVDQDIWQQIKAQQAENITVYENIIGSLEGVPAAAPKLTGYTSEEIQKYNDEIQKYNEEIQKYNKAIEQYNAVVDAYNKAVDIHNDKVMSDATDVVNKTFVGQEKHTSTTTTTEFTNTWYTVGRIYVGDIFEKNAEEISNKYAGTGAAYHSTTGRDVYYWDAQQDGTQQDGTTKLNDKTKTDGTGMYEKGQTSDSLEDRLFVKTEAGAATSQINTTGENFKAYMDKTIIQETTTPVEEGSQKTVTIGVDPLTKNGIEKWVLKVDNGADGYNSASAPVNAGGKMTLHLDGYMYVEKLSNLARLEARQEKKMLDPNTATDTTETVTVTSFTVGAEPVLKLANPYTPQEPVEPLNLSQASAQGFGDGFEFEHYSLKEIPKKMEKPGPTPPKEDPEDPREPDPTPPKKDPEDPAPPQTPGDPDVNIPDDPTPLAETPETPEPPTPETPENPEELDIPDEEVPLAEVPGTGDSSYAWYAMAILSACGLVALCLLKKREEA